MQAVPRLEPTTDLGVHGIERGHGLVHGALLRHQLVSERGVAGQDRAGQAAVLVYLVHHHSERLDISDPQVLFTSEFHRFPNAQVVRIQ